MCSVSTPRVYMYIACSFETPRKVSVQIRVATIQEKKTVRHSVGDGGYGDASEFSMCSRRSSTVQWGGSGWKEVASLADGRMLKEPESAPCERLSMSRPI